MAMRSCEWALKADEDFGQAIGLWIASYFKAEASGGAVPAYFGEGHADAMTYATTAGAEYLHQALARAVKDKDAHVALGVVEALGTTAGEASLFYAVGGIQPLAQALSFDSRAVKYSAAIAFANAGPKQTFAEAGLVVRNLADALDPAAVIQESTLWSEAMADDYAVRAAGALLHVGRTNNRVLDLSLAQDALVSATRDNRPTVKMLASQVLAYINGAAAQGAIATQAMDERHSLDIRISAFDALAVSGKVNGNLLDSAMVDSIYGLVSDAGADADLRAAAAGAFGALNLPSEKVKTLILDQAKS
jgi:hypothetical protein